MKKLSLLLLAILLISARIYAQIEIDSVRSAAWKTFKYHHGQNWQIRWNQKEGIPKSIFLSKTLPYQGRPEEIAKRFLEGNDDLFKMKSKLSDLSLARIQETNLETKKMYHVEFQQTYHGIPVYNAIFMVHVSEDGCIDMVNGTYYPDLKVPHNPKISENEASKIILSNNFKPATVKTELVIYPKEENFYLAWRISGLPGSVICFVDAITGNVITKYSDVMDLETSLVETYTYNGKYYPTYPNCNGSYWSNLTTGPLTNITHPFTLWGKYAIVRNDSSAAWGLATDSSGSFLYSDTDVRFDAVNVYYHINRYRTEYINPSFGFSNFDSIVAFVHSNMYRYNGQLYYDPKYTRYDHGSKTLEFSSGCEVDHFFAPAHEDKVIYHEYTHAIVRSIRQNLYSDTTQHGGISEGLADYFAGSFTNRPVIMDWVRKDNPDYQRNMRDSNPSHKNGNFSAAWSRGANGPHFAGEFFSSILWDIRKQMTYPANLDKIVYNTLFRINDTPTYQDFRDAMLAASQELYDGVFNTMIANAFYNRGVGVPSNTITINANISGPTNLSYMQPGIFVCTPTNGTGPYTYNWNIKTVCNGGGLDELAPCSYWTPIGTNNDSLIIGYQTSFLLRADLIDLNGNIGSSSVWTVLVSGSSAPKLIHNSEAVVVPDKFELSQNYPNPFNPTTTLKYALPKNSYVTIKLYNSLGAEVTTLVREEKPAGFYEVTFNGSGYASGVYFYKMTAGEFTETKKLILVK